jgi:hypothetical protein
VHSVVEMTDVEELEFLDLWLTGISQSMRDLSAAVQQFYEKLRREAELTDRRICPVAGQAISGKQA